MGEYIRAVDDAGLTERTIFIVTSDHGDMDMVPALHDLSHALHTMLDPLQEQQQFYKMVPYEASARVPLVVAGPGVVHAQFEQATSLIDLYPTLLELAKATRPVGWLVVRLIGFCQGGRSVRVGARYKQ